MEANGPQNQAAAGSETAPENGSQQAAMEETLNRYLPLYKAALAGDWATAEAFFQQDSATITAIVSQFNETVLHIVVGIGDHLDFVKKLVDLMCQRSLPLTQQDMYGNTALTLAAIIGSVEAARILVEKDSSLPNIINLSGFSPLLIAANYGHKDMIEYLLSVTNDRQQFTGITGATLLNMLILVDIFDIALELFKKWPKMAVEKDAYGKTTLQVLAGKPAVFESASRLGFLERVIYRYLRVFVKQRDASTHDQQGDIENPLEISNGTTGASYPPLTSICLMILKKLVPVPYIKKVYATRCMHVQAYELVKRVCKETLNVGGEVCKDIFSSSILLAAQNGTLEVATDIIKAYPPSIWFYDANRHYIFQLSVLHRKEKTYNLIYQMTSPKNSAVKIIDLYGNNILHLAGVLAPSDRISGAALQMQRELQWFKEVESLMHPSYLTSGNKDGKTPRMIFTENHKELVREGEEWMKNTASSSTVVAALVATVAFSAVFTAPGGLNGEEGIPILLRQTPFMIYAAADAVGFIASSISVMMFLGILTSRYSEEDFLKSLPTKMIIGLSTMFISIAAMVAAFSSSLYLLLVHHVNWVAIPIVILAVIPVILFARLQFPLLIEIINSTYGHSIFGVQSTEILY